MSAPRELSFEEILKFMLAHNGKVTNHELVKYFKVFLTNPDMRDDARNTFKKHVNSLAIIKNQNNEKWLILKKKYMTSNGKDGFDASCDKPNDSLNYTNNPDNDPDVSNANLEPIPYRPPPPFQLNQDLNFANVMLNNLQDSSVSVIPDNVKENITPTLNNEENIPKVHPRKPKSNSNQIANVQQMVTNNNQEAIKVNEVEPSPNPDQMMIDQEHKISVKERKQMFNRMASEVDILKPHQNSNQQNHQGVDEEDRASVVSLDQKESDPLDSRQKAWILCAARGDYHALAKMCSENPKLVKTKDPFTGYTAMHWACKRGDENLVKLLAGVAQNIVNERSNGGYTPLHIAMQFRHENLHRLLVKVYDADPNVRDWSGKKPMQYFEHTDTSFSPGSYRKKEGFLRIGSLNVRVKKTTEAFSNFLGVGATRSSTYVPKTARLEERSDEVDNLHKSWGSADNIPKDDKLMPPPMSNKVRRRGVSGRKGVSSHSRSTPTTPDQPRAQMGTSEEGDSDSDSAAGFHAAWRQRASDCV